MALAQSVPVRPARNEAELASLEAAYAVLDLYVWLSHRMEDGFPGRAAALQQRSAIAALVEEALPRIIADPEAISRRYGSMFRARSRKQCPVPCMHTSLLSSLELLGFQLQPENA